VHDPVPGRVADFEERDGLLFIGGYNHGPNVDAVEWLISEIMPLVWDELPALRLTLLGAGPPQSVLQLANDRVAVPGFVRNVDPFFRTARVFVAPLRYGAGVKGKIGQAMEYGLPIVTTDVGAEGFGITPGVEALVRNDARGFADAILALYGDARMWAAVAAASNRALTPFHSTSVVGAALALLDDVDAGRRHAVAV